MYPLMCSREQRLGSLNSYSRKFQHIAPAPTIARLVRGSRTLIYTASLPREIENPQMRDSEMPPLHPCPWLGVQSSQPVAVGKGNP
jgi:hypothetical protein